MKMTCKNCGANIYYILGTKSVKCEHCAKEYNIDDVDIREYKKHETKVKETIKEINTQKQELKQTTAKYYKPAFIDTLLSGTDEKIIPFSYSVDDVVSHYTELCVNNNTILTPIKAYAPIKMVACQISLDYEYYNNYKTNEETKKDHMSAEILSIKYAGGLENCKRDVAYKFDYTKMLDQNKSDYPKVSDYPDVMFLDEVSIPSYELITVDDIEKIIMQNKAQVLKGNSVEVKTSNMTNKTVFVPIFIIENPNGIIYVSGQSGQIIGQKMRPIENPFHIATACFILYLVAGLFFSIFADPSSSIPVYCVFGIMLVLFFDALVDGAIGNKKYSKYEICKDITKPIYSWNSK